MEKGDGRIGVGRPELWVVLLFFCDAWADGRNSVLLACELTLATR